MTKFWVIEEKQKNKIFIYMKLFLSIIWCSLFQDK
jgi:hypothetical protein